MRAPNDPTEPPEFGRVSKFLFFVAGAVEDILKQCAPRDHANISAIGSLMLCSLLYVTVLFFLIGKMLVQPSGPMWIVVLLAALGISSFILVTDRYVIIVSGYHREGLAQLYRAGMDIRGGVRARLKGVIVLLVRIGVLSVGLAQLTALFMSLLLFAPDIRAINEHT